MNKHFKICYVLLYVNIRNIYVSYIHIYEHTLLALCARWSVAQYYEHRSAVTGFAYIIYTAEALFYSIVYVYV